MILVHKVWIELELAMNCNVHNMNLYRHIPIVKHGNNPIYSEYIPWCVFWITQEFYEQQIEFNIWWCSELLNPYKKFLHWLREQKSELYAIQKWPAYIWTHIHFQFSDWVSVITKRMRNKKYKVFLALLKFYLKYFTEQVCINKKKMWVLKWEFWRILNNHNINIYWDYKFFKWEMNNTKTIITDLRFHYTNGKDKPKYQPILWSNPKYDKPFTFEVRAIPNIIWLDPRKLKELINIIKDSFNQKKIKNEIRNTKQDIIYTRTKLCELYNDVYNKYEVSIPTLAWFQELFLNH